MPLFDITGNCFIDAGIHVILNLTEKVKISDISSDDLKELNELLVEIYISNSWRGPLTQIFPNSKIANFSIKDRKAAYTQFLTNLIDTIIDSNKKNEIRTCWGCNQREGTIYVTRAEFPLTGAKKVVNYFPNWDEGVKICPNCLLAVQYSPLAMIKCIDKLLFLHSNSDVVMRTWTKEIMISINNQIINKEFLGIYDLGFKMPTNFFFEMASKIINNYDENWKDEKPFIRLYMFTNFLQSPGISFIDIPTRVFIFLANIKQTRLTKEWFDFIYTWTQIYSKDKDVTSEELIKIRKNYVFDRLIEDQPITGYFISYFRKHSKKLSWELILLYALEVLKLKEESIEYIKKIGDLIVELMKKMNNKKRLKQLESCKRIDQFRGVLLQIEKDCLIYENEPIFKLDEVIENLFPESEYGVNWKEMKDFLLLRIYEFGFEFLKQFKKEIESEIKEEIQSEEIEMEDV